MRIIHSLLLLFFLLMLQPTIAQENRFLFSHLKEENGLGDNIINCFLKDSRGILWIGTYDGFNRFDGANFFVYKKRKGANSMMNEVVHKLCEDKNGNIWGSTDKGVFRYETRNDRFFNYPIKTGIYGRPATGRSLNSMLQQTPLTKRSNLRQQRTLSIITAFAKTACSPILQEMDCGWLPGLD